MKSKLYTLLSFALLGCSSTPLSSCLETRGAIDLGSGSTTFFVAKYDKCSNVIVQREFHGQTKISFKEALTQSQNQRWSEAFQTQALEGVRQLVAKSKKKPERINAYATEAFRQAISAEEFIAKVESKLGFRIRILSQNEEAFLGLRSAENRLGYELTDTAVWDIGGASMQIVMRPDIVFEGKLAAVSFKEMVLEKILRKPRTTATPNPMSEAQLFAARDLAREQAAKTVGGNVRKHLLRSQGRVMGIGGVHNFSIGDEMKKLGKSSYTQMDLLALLKAYAGKTDEQIGGAYAATDATNVALILGFMEALQIDEVQLIPTDPVL